MNQNSEWPEGVSTKKAEAYERWLEELKVKKANAIEISKTSKKCRSHSPTLPR